MRELCGILALSLRGMSPHREKAKEKATATVQRGRQRAMLMLAIVEAPESEQIEGPWLWRLARQW